MQRLRKGRGAVSNRDGRFEAHSHEAADDGWGVLEEEPGRLRTSLHLDAARSVIAKNSSPDIPFDQSINPYRGCEHGCVYCFARPSHAYYGLSPGLDFETKLFHKPDAPEILRKELSRKTYRPKVIAMGTNTDPYQPVERQQRLTRRILEVLAEFGHPVTIVTKSALIERDLDILGPMAASGQASVMISVTTLDRRLANRLEPRASTPPKRLGAISALARAGVPVGVLVAPVIPALNDWEMERILDAAVEAGARNAGYILLRLPHEIKDLMSEWLEAHAPDKKDHVLSLIRQSRDGALYRAEFGKRMTGSGPYADMLRQRFHLARRKRGLTGSSAPLDISGFRVPPQAGDQLSLFG